MNNILYEVNNSRTLPECWLYENRKYRIHSSKRGKLPKIRKSYEANLKDLGISYRIVTDEYENEVCEYWNPESYEEEEITLPAYVKMQNGTYRYIKDYTGKVPTAYTIWEAWKLEEKVEQDKFDVYQYLKECLGERQAVGIRSIALKEQDFLFEEDHIKKLPVIMPCKNGGQICTQYCVVFDVNNIELNSIVTLEVPKGEEGLFVGTNGWQVKGWCQKLGLKAIKVVGI